MVAWYSFGRISIKMYGLSSTAVMWLGSSLLGSWAVLIGNDYKAKQATAAVPPKEIEIFGQRLPRGSPSAPDPEVRVLGSSSAILGLFAAVACSTPKSPVYMIPVPVPIPMYAMVGGIGLASAIAYTQDLLPMLGHTGHLGEAADLLPILINLQDKISRSDVGRQASDEPWMEGVRTLATEHGPLDQLREALEQLAVKLKPRKNLKSVPDAFVWPLDKKRCDEILNKIERVKSRINLALQGDIHKLVHEIRSDTAGIEATKQGISDLRNRVDAKEREDTLAWFSPLNFYQSQHDMLRKREKGTGQWLIDSPEFQRWIAGSTRTLCCSGIPGAGKSVLASVVVDFLRNAPTRPCSHGTAAAFCNFKETEIQSPENLLAGLCVQLITESQPLPETLVSLYKSHTYKQTRPALEDILDVIKETAKRFVSTYLIIDALDEYLSENRDILVRALKALQPMFKLLVTTRPIESITTLMHEFEGNATIEICASHGDLKEYITSFLSSSSKLSRILLGKAELAKEICDNVIERANGMFLAAKLHMDSLGAKMSIKTLRNAIHNLPTTLDQLYDEAFHRIDGQNEEEKDVANKALRWVAYTFRAFDVYELRVALAIEPEDTDFDSEALPEIDSVIEACAGLLILDKETKQVRLVHYTAQDYFNRLLVSKFADAHTSIARECITYLSYDDFQKSTQADDIQPSEDSSTAASHSMVSSSSESETDQLQFCLLRYVLFFWAQHAIAGQNDELDEQVYEFLSSNPRIWIDCHDYIDLDDCDHFSRDHLQPCNGTEIAAYFGLDSALKRMLHDGVAVNELGYEGLSALHLAAHSNQLTTLDTLLNHGADRECRSISGLTPLLCAIKNSSMEVAYRLVEKGANVKAHHHDRNEPFTLVSSDSPVPFLQLLLNHGADIDSCNSLFGTQLTRRVRYGDIKTVRWLLGKGADPHLSDFDGNTFSTQLANREVLMS
ncbi:MAG: hypothetical protein Q9170_005887 [Blastenia crenularia]